MDGSTKLLGKSLGPGGLANLQDYSDTHVEVYSWQFARQQVLFAREFSAGFSAVRLPWVFPSLGFPPRKIPKESPSCMHAYNYNVACSGRMR